MSEPSRRRLLLCILWEKIKEGHDKLQAYANIVVAVKKCYKRKTRNRNFEIPQPHIFCIILRARHFRFRKVPLSVSQSAPLGEQKCHFRRAKEPLLGGGYGIFGVRNVVFRGCEHCTLLSLCAANDLCSARYGCTRNEGKRTYSEFLRAFFVSYERLQMQISSWKIKKSTCYLSL